MLVRRLAELAVVAAAVLACGLAVVISAPSAPPARAVASAPQRAFVPAITAPAASTPPAHLAGCYGRLGINIASHTAYDCLYVPVNNGALYFGQTKYIFWYYWHPHHGDEVVTEIFYKADGTSWPGAVPASNNPLHNYAGLPPAGQFNWRIVTLADGCLVVAPTDTGPAPTTCTPTAEGGAIAGATRPMTALEQASVDAFWKVVSAAVPDAAW